MSATPAAIGSAIDPQAYAIAGRPPRAAVRPASREELCEVVRAAARDGESVVPWGGGAALPLEPAPERYDLAIDLTGLDRMVEYDPEDMTLTAECGVRLARLAETTAARGQELPLEAPHATRATLGGTLSANASGPRRLRLGSPRDRLLGARFVLGDGTLVRTGGRVVKNVAGYALHRLLCGSRGGLAILVEASLKLLPTPARRIALIYEAKPSQIVDRERWASLPRSEPAVLTVVGAEHARHLPGAPRAGSFWVCVGVEEDVAYVAEEEARLRQVLGEPATRLEGDAVKGLWQQLCNLEDASPARLTFAGRQGTPADLAPVLADPACVAALDRAVFHAPAGRLHVAPRDGESAALIRNAVGAGLRLIEGRGAGAFEGPAALGATLALRTRIREALDPDRRFELGERWIRSR